MFAKDEYFLTLRNETVNLRQGPSFDYPVKIFYKKKFLPVLIQDKSDTFRKIRDHENNSGWIHISQLSKKKAALTIDDDVLVFNKPTIYSTPKVILKKGRLCKIKKCKDDLDQFLGAVGVWNVFIVLKIRGLCCGKSHNSS